jgi:hypothetical protein
MGSYWPPFDLRLCTPRLVLRPHRDDDFPAAHFELTRDEWYSRRDSCPHVEIVGLEEALEMFSPSPSPATGANG